LIFEEQIADVAAKIAIQQAVAGGTTMVQIREKKKSTSQFIKEARELKALLRGSDVPLIINDRIDVALACDADGVHVGQTDMGVKDARKILGPNKIIGCTVSNPHQAKLALLQGADYLGTDAIYMTATKPESNPLGLSIFKEICDSTSLPVVAIGGVNRNNAKSCLNAGAAGLAACASILDPQANGGSITEACKELRRLVDLSRPRYSEELARVASNVIHVVRAKNPLIVHITNTVTINDVANVTLLCGASPVMAQENTEMVERADALVLNMGTLDNNQIETMISCGRVANKRGIPVVFDPVGAGATPYRTAAAKRILASIHVDILRGNASEIAALADLPASTRGVDSGVVRDKHAALKALASKDRIVVMTGKIDLLSDGQVVHEVHNNSAWLQTVTGTGCMLTAVLGAFSTAQFSHLETCTAALAYFAAAAEHAEKGKPFGPATFKQFFF
jgi:thiamine-phosphate diphosphorylase/hydroxyethylthiazole kinase